MHKTTLFALTLTGFSCCLFSCSEKNSSIPADHPDITYMGRTMTTPDHNVAFNFPGVTALLNFSGTSLEMQTSPGSGYFMVEIDSLKPVKIHIAKGDSTAVLASGLNPGNHSARITYAIEGYEFNPEFRSFSLSDGGKILPAPKKGDLKIEFIGNSITCGYGTEAPDEKSPFSYDTENHTLSYAYLTGRNLNADVNIVARSGIGVYRNFDGPKEGNADKTMPLEYENTLLYDYDHPWNFSSFRPDIVCINLGTNDTSTNNYDINIFGNKYSAFLDRVRELNPDSKIVLLTGSMLNGKELELVKSTLDSIASGRENVYRFDMTPHTGELGYGADYHPSAEQSKLMAKELTGFLKTIINQ